MAEFGIVHRFKGGTREQYENGLKVVHPDGGASLPRGQTLHIAGRTEDGWIVVAVHESRESWERFRDETLVPGLAQVQNGLPGPPDEFTFEVDRINTAEDDADPVIRRGSSCD
jgi:hypothetical protein